MKNKEMEIKNSNHLGFEPLIFEDSEILILGSFPSVKSRENNFYYGNPRNRFWKVLATAFNEELPKDIKEKKELCQKHKIALWDIFIESDLNGSSDIVLSKSNYLLSDIISLLNTHKNIKKILCNGALAYNTFVKNFDIDIPVVKLHSTSPACVTFDLNSWKENLNIDLLNGEKK